MTDSYFLSASSPLHQVLLHFDFVGDRFHHALFARPVTAGDGASVNPKAECDLLCQSIEGTPVEDWPPSPAIQEVSLEPIGGEMVALATGQAGCSYWSASVASIGGSVENAPPGFEFDVAVRTQQPAPFLGSTYAFPDESRLSSINAATWGVEIPSSATPWMSSQSHSTTLTVRLSAGYGEVTEASRLIIRPEAAQSPPANSLFTLRWKYSICCESASL